MVLSMSRSGLYRMSVIVFPPKVLKLVVIGFTHYYDKAHANSKFMPYLLPAHADLADSHLKNVTHMRHDDINSAQMISLDLEIFHSRAIKKAISSACS